MSILMEQYIPGLQQDGFLTNLAATFGSDVTVTGNLTVSGTIVDSGSSLTLSNASTTGATLAVATTGVYTGTGLSTITAASATTGTLFTITGAGLTTGNGEVGTYNALTTGFGTSLVSSSSALTSGHLLNAVVTQSSATLATRTGSVAHIESSSTGTAVSGTVSPTDNVMTIKGTYVQNGAGGTLAPSGSLLNLVAVSTQTAGTLTDTRTGITLTVPTGMTGAPIKVTQGNITSTHFYKLMTEASTGVTLWMGDGTTANGALSGTAGDILFKGGSNKPEYCTGTTNWTALV